MLLTPLLLVLGSTPVDQALLDKDYKKAWLLLAPPSVKADSKAQNKWLTESPALRVVQAARASEGKRDFAFCAKAFEVVANRLPELRDDLMTRVLTCARKAKNEKNVRSAATSLLEGPHRDVGLLALAGLTNRDVRKLKKGKKRSEREKSAVTALLAAAGQCDHRWCKASILALASGLAADAEQWKIDERLVKDFSDLLAGKKAWERSRRRLKSEAKRAKGKKRDWLVEFSAPSLLGRAESLLAAHENKGAVEAVQMVLKLTKEPEHHCRAYAAQGRALRKLRKHRDAVKAYGAFQAKKCPGVIGAGVAYGRIFSQSIVDPKPIPKLVKRALKEHPDHRLSDDYLFFLGEFHQRKKKPKAAVEAYEHLAKRYPKGDMAEEAVWRVAWTRYLADDHAGARERLDSFLRQHAGASQHRSADQIRALYWRARLSPKKDRVARYTALVEEHPFTWHGLMGLQRLRNVDLNRAQARFPQSLPARDPSPSLTSDLRFRRGVGLLALGLRPQAVQLLSSIETLSLVESDLEALSDRLIAAGGAHHAVGMLRRLPLWRQAPSPTSGRLWRLAFPLAHKQAVLDAAKSQNVPPALLFGLVREESGFDADVDSWAGARGLSQCMKSTARMVARKHRVAGWSWAKMREPEMNLKVGSLYLAGLLKRFEGAFPLAISSYNAGPGATRRMIKARPGFALDSWVEDLPIRQTRKYVQRVLASAWTYASLYPELGGLDLSNLKIIPLK